MKIDPSKSLCHRAASAPLVPTVEMSADFRDESIPQSMQKRNKHGKKSVTRGQMLSSIPVRNEAVDWKENNGQVDIRCGMPRRRMWRVAPFPRR